MPIAIIDVKLFFMTNNLSGQIGKSVTWTTCDQGRSYEPTINFGDFTLFIGRGTNWGANSVNGACVSLIVTESTIPGDDHDPGDAEDRELGSFQAELFLTTPTVRAACAYLTAAHLDTILSQVGDYGLLQDIVVAADSLIGALKAQS